MDETTATPLSRITWRTQAVLLVLLEDRSREVWPYLLDRHPLTRGADNYQILKRLAEAGWLSTRRETGPNGRVLYRLTAAGETMAREAAQRPVKWPDHARRRGGPAGATGA